MIEKLKTSTESNRANESTGDKMSQFRSKINEIIDYLNEKELREGKNTYVNRVSEILNELKSDDELGHFDKNR